MNYIGHKHSTFVAVGGLALDCKKYDRTLYFIRTYKIKSKVKSRKIALK